MKRAFFVLAVIGATIVVLLLLHKRQRPSKLDQDSARTLISVYRRLRDRHPEQLRAALGKRGLTIDQADKATETAELTLNQNLEQSRQQLQIQRAILRGIVSLYKPAPIYEGKIVHVLDSGANFFSPALTPGEENKIVSESQSVGRVESVDANNSPTLIGTAFVISQRGLIATNCHVIQRLLKGSSSLELSSANFRFDTGESPTLDRLTQYPITKILGCPTRTGLDVGFLQVDKMSLGGTPLPAALALQQDPLAPSWGGEGTHVALIGYPDLAHPGEEVYQELNQQAPGKYAKIYTPGDGEGLTSSGGIRFILHDATSDSGNSGSPLISIPSGTVIGVHNCCYNDLTFTPDSNAGLPCSFVFGNHLFNLAIASSELYLDPVLGALLRNT